MILAGNSKHWLEEISEFNASQIALVSSEFKTDYINFAHEVKSFSAYLSDAGVEEYCNVGVLFGHSKDFWICINALWFLNAVPVLLSTRNTREEICEQIKQVDIKFLLLDHELNSETTILNSSCKVLTIDKIDNSRSDQFSRPVIFSKTNNAIILFTSGSSGKPKAVVHTFESLFESVAAMDSGFALSNSDLWLASLPIYHIGGFMILLRSLLSGSTVAFPSSLKQEDLALAINQFRPTHVSFVSTILKRFVEIDFRPNENMKCLFLGGGYSSDELIKKSIVLGWPIVKTYGSSETGSMISAFRINSDTVGSSGKALDSNQIIIKDEEILVRSKSLFKEYYKDSESTKKKIVDGFFYTGDIGRIDTDGFLFIEARRSDLIISGGENISVSEIESVLLSIPFVSDCCVFALPDEHWGQIACAAIATSVPSEKEIKYILKEKIAGFKIPKKFFFVNKIPKTELGKVKKDELLKLLSLSEL